MNKPGKNIIESTRTHHALSLPPRRFHSDAAHRVRFTARIAARNVGPGTAQYLMRTNVHTCMCASEHEYVSE